MTANVQSQLPADADRGVEIIDFAMRRYSLIGRSLLVLVAGTACVLAFVVVFGLSMVMVDSWFPDVSQSARYWIVVASVLGVSALPGAPCWIIRDRRERARAIEASQLPIQQVLPHLLGEKQREPNAGRLQLITRALVGRGRIGHTFRVFAREEPWPLAPIRVTFDPEPLDEGASTFDRLAENVTGVEDERGDEESLNRRMRRSVRLRGGKFAVAFPAALMLMGASSLYQGRPPIMFVAGAMMMAGNLFWARGSVSSRQQLFLVPGAVIVRRAGALQDGWHLHMFKRSAANLILHESTMQGWMVLLSDAECVEISQATRGEVETLLRAWMSPLPPPPEDRLIDLL